MASRRGESKRKQIGSSSAGGQAQEEGNLVDNVLFVDDDAINRYNFFKNLAVLPCNCVKFSQFPQGDMRVEQIFRELGWKDYIEIKEPVYYEVVHQFYANLKPRENKCKTMVAGVSFQFSPRDICAVLDIPARGDDEFLDVNHALVRAIIAPNCIENQIKAGFLTPENRVLQWIISRIIAQRKGSKSYVLASDLPWFDYLLNGKRKGEQEGDEEEGDTNQEMAEQGAKEHEDDSPRSFRASMQRINRETMELMISEMQQLHTDFYGFRTKMRGRMTNVEGKLNQLVNHFFPPTPPDAN
ncbi:hypothetical protein SLEP1_g8709 [Rubroshorea leprosula]|uniref:Uncharacterized protein n=1 Tax=Rubroshorea leprosula TaxID=152421 RepID=A0AAV5IBP2_9ROSI|nr:hypothetical protein SLEP1_g8709 [Rubroshorea leprosula]